MATEAPITTVYVRNLEERIKIPTLKETLTEIFAEFGSIVDIVAKTNLKARGQAFVIYDDPDAAEAAVETVQDFEIFGKPMRVGLAKAPSDATVRAHGSEEEYELFKRHRLAEKERKQAIAQQEEQKLKRPAPAPPEAQGQAKKPLKGAGLKSTSGAAVVPDEYLPPNKILFVQGVPDEYDVDALSAIFGRFDGFKEVRMVPGRKGLAFVEYDAETGAISAKENTAGMGLGNEGKPIKVTFQRQ
ncbi:MAG: hypothetical protein M1828_003416 [Chrysothrix sp. TS-e1954]|nr:MAG: hypothetical protein M1828_003416 [Chrysothrix sp. TS-e1954]